MEIKKAIALKYPNGVEAPIVVAKGSGKKAEKILEIAKENSIFIKEDAVLVEMLGLSELGDSVPPDTWTALAKIFSFILDYKENSN